MRAAVYARVSTFDQEPENQLQELRRYVQARGWTMADVVLRTADGAPVKISNAERVDAPNVERRAP